MLWRRSISPRGEVYKRYRMGPRTEPWGTPHERECLSDSDTSIWTNWERSVKYDVNQSSALPLVCLWCGRTVGQAVGRSVYGHVITKFYRMGRLIHFLTHGAPLVRFARESSAKNYFNWSKSSFFYAIGRVSLPRFAGYCITKYGVQAFSDALRREMRPWGVQVSIIEPGLFKTALTDAERNIHSVQELWDALSPELKQEYGEKRLEKSKVII